MSSAEPLPLFYSRLRPAARSAVAASFAVALLAVSSPGAAAFTQATCPSGGYDTPFPVRLGSLEFDTSFEVGGVRYANRLNTQWTVLVNRNVKWIDARIGPSFETETNYDYLKVFTDVTYTYTGAYASGYLFPWLALSDSVRGNHVQLLWHTDVSVTRVSQPHFDMARVMCHSSVQPTTPMPAISTGNDRVEARRHDPDGFDRCWAGSAEFLLQQRRSMRRGKRTPFPDGIADDAVDRFWVLAPVGVDESVVAYSVVASGSAPARTSFADAFLGSEDGRHVVAFGEAHSGAPSWLRVFDLETASWQEVSLEPALPTRANAAYVLREHGLYRAGGEASGSLAGDAIAIDWRSGHFEIVIPGGQLPPRSRPLLTWDVQGEGIIYGGGVGTDGAAHNDLWSVRAGHGVAARLVADTAPVTRPLDPSGLVLATGFTREAIWWDAPNYVPGAGVLHALRRSELGGWVEANVVTKAADARTCSNGSIARRCASGSDWWRTPGTTCAAGTCELGRTEQAAASLVLPGAAARDIALEHSTLWVARGTKIERWSLLAPGSAAPVASVDLGAPITAIAARDGVVLAATAKQVARVAMVEGTVQVLQAGIPICRTESITRIGLRGWLVATPDGAALLQANDTGALEVASEIELAMVKGKWSAIPAKKTGKQCSLPPAAGGAGEDLASRVSFDGTNAELAHGNDVFRLSWDASGQLALLDVTSVTGKVLDLRATADRAYLVGKHPHQKTDLGVVLLGQSMQLDGQHDVADWVESEQSGPYRARITQSGGVEVAWLAH